MTLPLTDSDQQVVMCKLRVSAHLKKCSTPRQQFSKLDHDYLNIQDSKILLYNSVLNEQPINHETKNKYDELAYAMEKSTQKTIPKRNRSQPGWFKED